jgi:hypothetical protein
MNNKIENPIVIGETSWKLLSELEKDNIRNFANKYSTVIDIIKRDTYYIPHYISEPYKSIALTTTIYSEFRECFDYRVLRDNINNDKYEIINKLDDIFIRDKVLSILENDYNYKIYK